MSKNPVAYSNYGMKFFGSDAGNVDVDLVARLDSGTGREREAWHPQVPDLRLPRQETARTSGAMSSGHIMRWARDQLADVNGRC